MKLERITWIDVCRGIAILLVIYGHALSSDSYRYVIYAFHIPLFFYLSGIVHHYKKSESFKHMLQKSVKRNLAPYFLFAILTYLAALTTASSISLQNILYQLLGIVYGSGNYDFLGYNVALWFLPCLFITKVGFSLIEKISDTKKFLTAALVVLSIAGYVFSVAFPTLHLPFGTEIALTGMVFFGLGYLTELKREEIAVFLKKYAWLILPICCIMLYLASTENFDIYGKQVDMRINKLGNYFLFYIGAISGIIIALTASILINKNRILEYLGQHSLILYVWHTIIFVYFNKYIKVLLGTKEINSIRNIYLAPLYTIAATTIILFINGVYNKAKIPRK